MSILEKDEELHGSKLSIEEVGNSREYIPPDSKSDDEEEKNKDSHYLVLFAEIEKLQKLVQKYRLYLINGPTEENFAKVLHKLIQLEKRLHNGIQVPFHSSHADDLYRIIFQCKNCASCKFAITAVDKTKCICKLDSKDFLSVGELLALECKNCGSSSPDMRLKCHDSFKSCLEFELICNNETPRTSTKAEICITTLDSNGRVISEVETFFAVCFHNMDGVSTKDKKQKNDHQILKKNQENILAKMTNEKQVIQILIEKKVISSDFEVDNLARKDLIGKMLRYLFISSGSVLTQFIEALRATNRPQNLELADILCNKKIIKPQVAQA